MALSRRHFLRGASGALGFAGAAAAMNRLFGGEAFGATLSAYAGYRALVAVFLLGGNDTNNVLVPRATNGSGTGAYDRYIQARPNVGLDLSELLAISPAGLGNNSYGIHFKMPKVRALFAASKAAFVCNVGPLVLPITKSAYLAGTVDRPENLFSHSDQQDAWASAIANPMTAALPSELEGRGPTGWAGRFADRVDHLNPGTYPEYISFGGKALLGLGIERMPFSIGGTGQLGLRVTSNAALDDLRDGALEEVLEITNGRRFEQAYGSVALAAIAYSEDRAAARDATWSALPPATRIKINKAFDPNNAVADPLDGALGLMKDGSLLGQMYQVVRDIIAGASAAPGLGQKRQVFSTGLGGFDTHSGQRATQDALLAQVDTAIGAFQAAMEALAASGSFGATPPQATLFTMSDFGRTLVENSDGGTDHAWGSHVLVVGSNVAGGSLYGAFPNLDMSNGGANNDDTTDARGRWIPTLSVEQVANTLAYWMGATSGADRAYMFPNLADYYLAAPAGSLARQYRLPFMAA